MSTPNMKELLEQAQQMQDNLQKIQSEIAEIRVTGEAGAGLVKVVMRGNHTIEKFNIDKSTIDEGIDVLEDLTAAAVNDAVRKLEEATRGRMGGMASAFKMPEGFNNPFNDDKNIEDK